MAQQDYFYAETLIDNGQYAEAVRVLDHLIDSGAYADRPRFAMMTLNLAGNTKRNLGDTAGARNCFERVMHCYDTLSVPRKADDWNRREYYKGGQELAWLHYCSGNYNLANSLLVRIGKPGAYYSATGLDGLHAEDHYAFLRCAVFQKLNQPDSAFACIRAVRNKEDHPVAHTLDSMFDVSTNTIQHVKAVPFTWQRDQAKNKTPAYLYFVSYVNAAHTQCSVWFINPEQGALSILAQSQYNTTDPQNFPANCYAMSLSPDEKYLAVECYTEGSNTVQVISFPELIAEKKCIVKHELIAYPAALTIKGWQHTQLCLESEADLTKINKKGRLQFPDYPGDDAKKAEYYLFDPESGKYSHR